MGKYINKDVENVAIFKDKNYIQYDPKKRDMHPDMGPHIRVMATSVAKNSERKNPTRRLTMSPYTPRTGKQKRDAARMVFRKGIVDKLFTLFLLILKDKSFESSEEREAQARKDLNKFLSRKNLIGATVVKTKLNANKRPVAEKSFTLTRNHFKQVRTSFV